MLNLFNAGTIKAVGNIVDDLFTTDEERQQAKITLEKIQAELKAKQMDINLAEAQHKSIFVAGWRPAVGWLIVMILFYSYILQPFVIMILKIIGKDIDLPNLNMSEVMPIILGMLGLSFGRSFEKSKGVARDK